MKKSSWTSSPIKWSGRGDLNSRPLAPQASALARLRYAPNHRAGSLQRAAYYAVAHYRKQLQNPRSMKMAFNCAQIKFVPERKALITEKTSMCALTKKSAGIPGNATSNLHWAFSPIPPVQPKAAVTREALLSLISLFYSSQISESSSHMSEPVFTAISQSRTHSFQNP